eukprot:1136852-Pelagomonas_calceolata.AAC.8
MERRSELAPSPYLSYFSPSKKMPASPAHTFLPPPRLRVHPWNNMSVVHHHAQCPSVQGTPRIEGGSVLSAVNWAIASTPPQCWSCKHHAWYICLAALSALGPKASGPCYMVYVLNEKNLRNRSSVDPRQQSSRQGA